MCASESRAREVYEEYRFLAGMPLYPAKDFLFYQADLRSRELMRSGCLSSRRCWSGGDHGHASFDAFMDALPAPDCAGAGDIH